MKKGIESLDCIIGKCEVCGKVLMVCGDHHNVLNCCGHVVDSPSIDKHTHRGPHESNGDVNNDN